MNEHPQQMERAVLDSLVRGEREPVALVPHRLGAVKVALQASLQSEEAPDEVRRLLQLIVALEQKLASPGAAAQLRDVLRSDPDAMILLQRCYPPSDDMVGPMVLEAPQLGEAAFPMAVPWKDGAGASGQRAAAMAAAAVVLED